MPPARPRRPPPTSVPSLRPGGVHNKMHPAQPCFARLGRVHNKEPVRAGQIQEKSSTKKKGSGNKAEQGCVGRVVLGLEEEGQGRALREMASVHCPSLNSHCAVYCEGLARQASENWKGQATKCALCCSLIQDIAKICSVEQ